MPAPKPQLNPYSTGFPIRTGRTRLVGGWADVALNAYGANGKYLVGWSEISIEGVLTSIIPVVTWNAFQSGMYYMNLPDNEVDTNIPDTRAWNSAVNNSQYNIKLCWMLEIQKYSEAATDNIEHIFILKDICSGSYVDGYWRLPALASATSSWSLTTRLGAREIFSASEHASNWPDNAREEGMRLLTASFVDKADTPYGVEDCTYNVDGEDYPIAANFGGSDPLNCGCYLGLYSIMTDNIEVWDPNSEINGRWGYGTLNNIVSIGGLDDYSKRVCAAGSIGSSEMPMYLPRKEDDTDFQPYRLWDKWNGSWNSDDAGDYECEFLAEGNTAGWYACGKTNKMSPLNEPITVSGGVLRYTKYNWAYRLNLQVIYMDGDNHASDPQVLDRSTPFDGLNVQWTGKQSPIRSGGGTWTIEGTSERDWPGVPGAWLIPDPPYATHADRAADLDGDPNNDFADAFWGVATGGGGSFGRDEDWTNWYIGPFELKNPGTFGLPSDCTRILLKYPRHKTGLTLNPASCVIDDFTAANWTAYNCTITPRGLGGITVTNVQAGAYIRRTYSPAKHAPVQRYWRTVKYVYLAGTSTPTTSDLNLTVKGTGYDNGGPVAWTKTFTHKLRSVWWDTCRPVEARGNDTEQSYIYQATPEDDSGENSIISWGWGIGLMESITISNLEAGKDYVFTSLDGARLTTDRDGQALASLHQSALLVSREYNPFRLLGTVQNPGEQDTKFEVERIGMLSVNGRIGMEFGGLRRSTVFVGETGTVDQDNLSIKEIMDGTNRWPASDFTSIVFTNNIPWSDGWWNAGLGDAGEYISEDALMCPEVAPAWWLYEGVHTNMQLACQPVYDRVSVGPHYGTGANVHTEARPDCIELYATIIVGHRVDGILWDEFNTAEETNPITKIYDFTVSNPAQGQTASALGSFFTPYQLSPTTVEFESASQEVTQTRHNTWTRLCMFIHVVTGAGLDMLVHRLTGDGFLAKVSSGNLSVQLTHDFGTSFDTEIVLDDSGAVTGAPCIAVDPEHQWIIGYCDSEGFKRLHSSDYFTTTAGEGLMLAGVNHGRIFVNPDTGYALVAGRNDDGEIVVAGSYDYGNTVGASVVAASGAADTAFGLTCTPSSTGRWCIAYTDSVSGDVKVVCSDDDGATWMEVGS